MTAAPRSSRGPRPALPGPPPRLVLPGGASSDDDGAAAAASHSTEIVAPAAPGKQSLRDLFILQQPAPHKLARAVSGKAEAEPRCNTGIFAMMFLDHWTSPKM